MSKVIGIDFGTSNSVVSVIANGKPVVIPNSEGNRLTPSVVGFTKDGQWLVGQAAKRRAVSNPDEFFSSIKYFMGKTSKVSVGGKSFTPQEVAAKIFQKLKDDAESFLGETVTQAVIAVPAAFTNKRRQAIKNAAEIAGLEVLRMITDSTAAALAYGFDKNNDETILVFNLGGKNFDVSIVEIDEHTVEVKATNGDANLGGNDFDKRIFKWLVTEFNNTNDIDLIFGKVNTQRLFDAAEKAKIELSSVTSTNINLPFIVTDATGPKHLDLTLTRAKFDELTRALVERTMELTRNAMKDAGLTVDDIDKIILVGGSSRIPAVQKMIRELFGKEPYKGINPDESVSIGAAIFGGSISGEFDKDNQILLLDVTPFSIGIETSGGLFTKIIERITTIPTRKSYVFSTETDNQSSVEIHILQGENDFAEDNETLQRFELKNIPLAPHGIPQIEVTIDIERNGLVNVSAKNLVSKS